MGLGDRHSSMWSLMGLGPRPLDSGPQEVVPHGGREFVAGNISIQGWGCHCDVDGLLPQGSFTTHLNNHVSPSRLLTDARPILWSGWSMVETPQRLQCPANHVPYIWPSNTTLTLTYNASQSSHCMWYTGPTTFRSSTFSFVLTSSCLRVLLELEQR